MIDKFYVNLISARLDKFKQCEMACTILGVLTVEIHRGTKTNLELFFTKKSGLVYKCHNCGVGRSFGNFLKDHCSDIYDEYVMERYKSGLTGKGRNVAHPVFKTEKPKFKKNLELENIASLNRKLQ